MPDSPDSPIVMPHLPLEEPAGGGGPERRTQTRFPLTAGAEVYEHQTKIRITGRCSDLGPGGCYIDTLNPFAVGSEVTVRVNRDGREFEAGAIVSYAHPQMGMGMTFTQITPEHQGVLRSWVAELSGEQTEQPEILATTSANAAAAGGDRNLRFVLNELIALLVHRKLIGESEGDELLRMLLR